MINCLRSFSSLSAGFLNVDLGVGTGFRFVAGDPGLLATSEVTFGDSPFMSKLLQTRSLCIKIHRGLFDSNIVLHCSK